MSLPTEGQRFSEYDEETNHQPLLWILTHLSLSYSVVFLAVRIFLKKTSRGADDAVVGVAHVIALAQWVVMYFALERGIGKAPSVLHDDTAVSDALKLAFASRILAFIVIGLTQCAILFSVRQIFIRASQNSWKICTGCAIAVGATTAISILITSIGCDPGENFCSGDSGRMWTATALQICADIVVSFLPAYLLFKVRISPTKRLQAASIFLIRLGNAALFIAYTQSYVETRKPDMSVIRASDPLNWQQVILFFSLLTATLPCLQAFLLKFYTFDFDILRAMLSALEEQRREELYEKALIKHGLLDPEDL